MCVIRVPVSDISSVIVPVAENDRSSVEEDVADLVGFVAVNRETVCVNVIEGVELISSERLILCRVLLWVMESSSVSERDMLVDRVSVLVLVQR